MSAVLWQRRRLALLTRPFNWHEITKSEFVEQSDNPAFTNNYEYRALEPVTARDVVDVRQAAEAWLVSTARKAGSHGVTADQESMMRLGYEAGYRAALQAAQPAVPSVPEGMRVVGRVQRGPAPHDPLYALILPGVDDSTIPEGAPLYALAATTKDQPAQGVDGEG